MSVRTVDVGRKTECPDCGHRFTIEKSEIKLDIPDPIIPEDEYGLKDVSADDDEARRKMGQSIMSQAHKELKEQAERKDLNKRTQGAFEERKPRNYQDSDDEEKKPREQLTPIDYDPRAELVDFPVAFTPHELKRDAILFSDVGLLMRWVFLSIFTAITIYAVANAVYYGMQPTQNLVTYVASLLGTAAAVIIGSATLVFLGSNFLFLIMSISSGIDEWDWPELGIFDRLMEALFLVAALMFSMIPFGIVATIDFTMAIPLLAFAFFSFPVFYLSLLDQGSIFVPWSSPIVGSLFRIAGKWMLFYLATFLLFTVILIVGYGIYFFAGIERLAYIALPGGVLVVGGSFIYALWLGRISWEIAVINSRELGEEAN